MVVDDVVVVDSGTLVEVVVEVSITGGSVVDVVVVERGLGASVVEVVVVEVVSTIAGRVNAVVVVHDVLVIS